VGVGASLPAAHVVAELFGRSAGWCSRPSGSTGSSCTCWRWPAPGWNSCGPFRTYTLREDQAPAASRPSSRSAEAAIELVKRGSLGSRARCVPGPAGSSGDSRGTAVPVALRPRSGTSHVSRHPHTPSSKLATRSRFPSPAPSKKEQVLGLPDLGPQDPVRVPSPLLSLFVVLIQTRSAPHHPRNRP
jgi:hypothetical protein